MTFFATGAERNQLVAALAAIVVIDAGQELNAENLTAVIATSGNNAPLCFGSLYASYINKAGGVFKFFGFGPITLSVAPSAYVAPEAVVSVVAAVKEEEPSIFDDSRCIPLFPSGGVDY